METTLAACEDAVTILKLYELRQEPVMRKARAWMTADSGRPRLKRSAWS